MYSIVGRTELVGLERTDVNSLPLTGVFDTVLFTCCPGKLLAFAFAITPVIESQTTPSGALQSKFDLLFKPSNVLHPVKTTVKIDTAKNLFTICIHLFSRFF